jgi:hypothetical protein
VKIDTVNPVSTFTPLAGGSGQVSPNA